MVTTGRDRTLNVRDIWSIAALLRVNFAVCLRIQRQSGVRQERRVDFRVDL